MTYGWPASAGPVQHGFGVLVPPHGQASGTGGLLKDYRLLARAVTAIAAETGEVVTCTAAAQRVGLDLSGRRTENVRAKLRGLEDCAALQPGGSPLRP